MVTYFNKKDLVEFGKYLLSDERRMLIISHPEFTPESSVSRFQEVSHADVENFLHHKTKPVVIELTKHTPEQLEAVKNRIKNSFIL